MAEILIPKFGKHGRAAARADRMLRDPEVHQKYVEAEKIKYRGKAANIFKKYRGYKPNLKSELRLEGVVDLRTWFRWQQQDPYFWHDDKNVKKFFKDNKETQPWKR
tara:strand:+ start:192 stop:509 length:318 start_codon:yes stop_codon:yes gene_type:complete